MPYDFIELLLLKLSGGRGRTRGNLSGIPRSGGVRAG